MRVNRVYLDVRVKHVSYNGITAAIFSRLSAQSVVCIGESIDVFEDKILNKAETK